MTAASPLENKAVLVTGGGGFLGSRLLAALARHRTRRLLAADVSFQFPLPPGCEQHDVDLSDGQVAALLEGVDLCLHVASYGMSGGAMLDTARVIAVNVGGTCALLDGCKTHGVRALVYVSTYNVVFAGQEIVAGEEEKLPYVADDRHVDNYSRTKCQAEQMVLKANCRALRTAAVRPAAIYGEGETRHLPRIARVVNQGLGFFAIGSQDVLCDWVHVDNLVHALLLSAEKLLSGGLEGEAVAGEAFFVSDGHPVNNFAFLSSILAPQGHDLFWMRVPGDIMYAFAAATETLHAAVSPWLPFEPFLTRAEVCKVGYTHYMSISKARRLLGYRPVVPHDEAARRTRDFFAPQVQPNGWLVHATKVLMAATAAGLLLLLLLFHCSRQPRHLRAPQSHEL